MDIEEKIEEIELTKQEREFLKAVLSQLNIKVTQPDAMETVMIVRAILAKL